MSQTGSSPLIIMENSDCEFDGICDLNGVFHFIIQDIEGALFYIRYDNNVWKKYNLFTSKEKRKSISHICLSSNGKTLCAFYIMEHQGKFMLIKHIFSSDNLRTTPSVIDVLDFRKDFCVCTHIDGNTHIYYRNEKSSRSEIIFDKNFSAISPPNQSDTADTYVLKVISNGTDLISASICARRNHTALVFKSKGNEKIITFAVAKNSPLSLCSKGEHIEIFWQEGNFIMHSESTNGGKDFSKPKFYRSKSEFLKVRIKGEMPGIYRSEYVCESGSDFEFNTNHFLQNKDKYIKKGGNIPLKNDLYNDIEPSKFLHKLAEIEKEIEKIGIGIDKICIFLDRLVQFKKDAENPKHSFSPVEKISDKNNIGEKNEDNIKLFENMSIDDAIRDKERISEFQGKESENEHAI